MEPQDDVSELRWADGLLMLLIMAGLAFSLLLQAAPQPYVVLDALGSRVNEFLHRVLDFVIDGLQAVLALAAGLLLEIL